MSVLKVASCKRPWDNVEVTAKLWAKKKEKLKTQKKEQKPSAIHQSTNDYEFQKHGENVMLRKASQSIGWNSECKTK